MKDFQNIEVRIKAPNLKQYSKQINTFSSYLSHHKKRIKNVLLLSFLLYSPILLFIIYSLSFGKNNIPYEIYVYFFIFVCGEVYGQIILVILGNINKSYILKGTINLTNYNQTLNLYDDYFQISGKGFCTTANYECIIHRLKIDNETFVLKLSNNNILWIHDSELQASGHYQRAKQLLGI